MSKALLCAITVRADDREAAEKKRRAVFRLDDGECFVTLEEEGLLAKKADLSERH